MASLSDRFVPPEGSDNPLIYVVAEAPGQEEDSQLRPLIGRSGQLFRSALEELGLTLDKVRLFNTVPYRPLEDDNKSNRTPSQEEILEYREIVKQDIRLCNPKSILCLGGTAASALTDIFDWSVGAFASNHTFKFEDIPIRVCWHPSYILRQGGSSGHQYNKWLSQIKEAIIAASPSILKDQNTEEMKFDIYYPDKIDEFLNKFEDAELIGYDIEGSSLETLSKDFHIAGISFARSGYAAYMAFKHFDNYDGIIEDSIKLKIKEFLGRNQNKVAVFNLCYEVPASFNIFNIELLRLQDTMQYCRVLNWTGGLKEISALYLNERRWTDYHNEWLINLTNVINLTKPRWRKGVKYQNYYMQIIESDGFNNVIKKYEDQESLACEEDSSINVTSLSVEELKNIKRKYNHINDKDTSLITSLKYIKDTAYLYNIPEDRTWINLLKILQESHEIGSTEAKFTQSPAELVGEYCCRDSWNTRRLHELTIYELTKRSA